MVGSKSVFCFYETFHLGLGYSNNKPELPFIQSEGLSSSITFDIDSTQRTYWRKSWTTGTFD